MSGSEEKAQVGFEAFGRANLHGKIFDVCYRFRGVDDMCVQVYHSNGVDPRLLFGDDKFSVRGPTGVKKGEMIRLELAQLHTKVAPVISFEVEHIQSIALGQPTVTEVERCLTAIAGFGYTVGTQKDPTPEAQVPIITVQCDNMLQFRHVLNSISPPPTAGIIFKPLLRQAK